MSYMSVLLLLSLCSWNSESYKILAIFPVYMHSHYEINSKLLRGLARKGHEVTAYTPCLQETPVKNLNEISVVSIVEKIKEHKKNLFALGKQSSVDTINWYFDMSYLVTEETLKHEEIQKLFKSDDEYDVILLSPFVHEGLISITHRFKKPVILVATMPLFPWTSFVLSHPSPSSYVPNLFSQFTGHMNFWQRLANSYYDAYAIFYHQFVMLPKFKELVKKHVPGQPDIYEHLRNVSLILINSHMSINEVFPQVPNAIEIGGLHVEEPKKLPEDLQKFLDDSVNGVVLFSLGSNLQSSQMPPNQRDEILRAFSKLKENVLWKWEEDNLPGQPKNVKIMKWLPQADVLAHPSVKAFITHGGLLSITESIYHAVPIIGIPFFGDQRLNMAFAVSNGYGIQLTLQELNEEKLTWALDEILNNIKYRNSAKKRSNVMRDQPMKPLDTATYWIEYVIRHQGALHLRYPGMDLSWYQRIMLDTVAFITVTTSLVIYIIITILKKTVSRIRKPHDKEKKTN